MDKGRKTEDRIVQRALELFNEQGIEYVGLRELAADLGIRVGNITYYFATKDHLVCRLSDDLKALNSGVLQADKDISLLRLFQMLDTVLSHHYRYRCLMLSFVHLMQHNPMFAQRYPATQNLRSGAIQQNLDYLEQQGRLRFRDKTQREGLAATWILVLRFWLSESAVSFPQRSLNWKKQHYLRLLAHQLEPWLSASGRRECSVRFPWLLR